MDDRNLLARITSNPEIFGGKPIIRGMRISVELILSLLAQGTSTEEILSDYPSLTPEEIRACLAYARAVIANDMLRKDVRCLKGRFAGRVDKPVTIEQMNQAITQGAARRARRRR